jgi:hypothetical protein
MYFLYTSKLYETYVRVAGLAKSFDDLEFYFYIILCQLKRTCFNDVQMSVWGQVNVSKSRVVITGDLYEYNL